MLLDSFTDAIRNFQYDYIFIDAVFLIIWLFIIIKNKKWKPLKAGLLTAIIVYIIDAVWWWNTPWGSTFIREYWIGGVEIQHPFGPLFLLKFGADFMMCISYSLFAFTWLWIMFENIEKKDTKEVAFFTILYFSFWMAIPILSNLLPINDMMVNTVRHMDTQLIVWIVNVFVGYSILAIIYGTNKFGDKNPKILLYVLIIGCLESFFMEFPLFITGIRPTDVPFLIYEIFFLFNQGAPYLYILWDKVLPFLKEKKELIQQKRNNKNNNKI